MSKIIFYLVFLLLGSSFLVVPPTNAQEASNSATKFNITFPVAELGNCTSVSSCKTYCSDATHQDACIAFAKKKGFYKEPPAEKNNQTLTDAKTELGCSSGEQCKSFCSQSENIDKCRTFAEKHGIKEPKKPNASGSAELMQKAKTTLGCDSPQSCSTLCTQPENREKCSNFAQQNKLSRPEKNSDDQKRMRPSGMPLEKMSSVGSQMRRPPGDGPDTKMMRPSGVMNPETRPSGMMRQPFTKPVDDQMRNTTEQRPLLSPPQQRSTSEIEKVRPQTQEGSNTEVKGISTSSGIWDSFRNWLFR